MQPLLWGFVGVGLLGLVAWLFVRRRRKKKGRLVAFVALLREPIELNGPILAEKAGRAWDADLGEGSTEGADGYVAYAGPFNMIMHQGRMFLVNSMPAPYVENPEEAARSIPDLRIREGMMGHTAWFSCDALGVDRKTPKEEVVDWYRRLGKLFVEFLDENCLLIHVPDLGMTLPVNDDTRQALLSDDPIQALLESRTLPIIAVDEDDPAMREAVAKARSEWPEFAESFESSLAKNHCVKAPIRHSGNTEFIWINVTAIEGERIYGTLANETGSLGPLKLGSKVSVPVAELNDWVYLAADGTMRGGFTVAAVAAAAKRKPKD